MRQLDHRGRCTRQLTSEMLTALSWSRQHQEFIQRERIDLPRELRLTVPGRGGSTVTLDGVWPAITAVRDTVIAKSTADTVGRVSSAGHAHPAKLIIYAEND